jgi:multiple sugar transport system substrate-binding protein
LPFGVVGKAPQTATMLNAMLFRHSKYPSAAKSYIQFMMESEQYDPWLTGCLGYWSHTLRAYGKSAVWDSDPKLEVYRNGTDHQFWSGYKGPITQASQTVAAEYVLVQMCASVASGEATPQEAAREAKRRSRRYFRG